MGRDVEKARSAGADKKSQGHKGHDVSATPKHDGKENKRGWRDVFDSMDYTDGPGDNIYVFG